MKNKSSSSILSVIIIGLLILVGGYIGYNYYYINCDVDRNITKPIVVDIPIVSDTNISTKENEVEVVDMEKPKAFEYTPITPNSGKTKAVIELGSDGFNYFVVKLDKDKNWDIVKSKWGLSLLYEGSVDPKRVLDRVTQSISDIQSKYKVTDIHFLISSGALNLPATQEIVQTIESRYMIEKITPEKEGKLAFYATIPKEFRESSFVLDIGSNNTKIAWMNSAGKVVTRTTYGAKYYKHNFTNKEVYNDVKSKAEDIPKNRRKHCFIIGGAPYKLAKKTRVDKKERYTVLYFPEDYFENSEIYGLKLEGKKVDSGLNIYSAVYDATETKQFIFDWKANFTIGYLLRRKF